MIKVKICGIKNQADLNIINQYKADFAGFIMAESKRKVSLDQLKELLTALEPNIVPVGVFVNQGIDFVIEAVQSGIRVVQLHGDEDSIYVNKLRDSLSPDTLIWKAVRIGKEDLDLTQIKNLNVDGYLLDTYHPNAYGGTGESFEWEKAKTLELNKPIILAGGLKPENVREAIETACPYCVDVSSGVEVLGDKDEEKVKVFVHQVRE